MSIQNEAGVTKWRMCNRAQSKTNLKITVNKTIYHESEMHNENHIQPKKWQWDKLNRKLNVLK